MIAQMGTRKACPSGLALPIAKLTKGLLIGLLRPEYTELIITSLKSDPREIFEVSSFIGWVTPLTWSVSAVHDLHGNT